jgi:hypothetical protein
MGVARLLWERSGKALNRVGVDPAVMVKFVCRPCNQGWLGSLEGNARPLVGALINDLSLRLDSEQQSLVARWAVKMAMVLEATRGASPEFFFFDRHQRHAFRGALAIPVGTTVWVGRYDGKMFSYATAMDGSYDGTPGWHSTASIRARWPGALAAGVARDHCRVECLRNATFFEDALRYL